MEHAEAAVAFISVPVGEAARLAEGLVSGRLAACAQVLPSILSFYRWQGRMEREEEAMVLVKTVKNRERSILAYLKKEHPYEVPEFVMLPVTGGNPDYLTWLAQETAAPGEIDAQ